MNKIICKKKFRKIAPDRHATRKIFLWYHCILSTIHWMLILADAVNGTVRLFRNGIISSYSGIVQIYIDGLWGNICDDSDYDQYEADVICHQLGYTGASSYSRAGSMRYSL